MKSFQRTLLFSALVFQKRCKGRAFFNTIQIYAAIFFAFLLHFSANIQNIRYVTKHVFARTLLQEAVSYTLLYKRGDLRLGLSDSGWTGNAAAGFVLSLHRRAEQYRKRDAIATRGADFVGI